MHRWIVVPTVVATLTAAGVFYAWLKNRSGRVWPVAFAHSTVNVLIDGARFVVILSPTAFAHTASESGFVTLASVAAFAVFLLLRGRTIRSRATRRSTSPRPPAEPSPGRRGR